MSSTSTGTGYTVTVSVGPVYGGTLNFGSDAVSDDLMLKLVEAINALPWPGGAKPATASKTVSTTTMTAPDFTQNPPAFT